MSLSPNIATNKLSVAERWRKLYRTVFNKFLKKDFVHIKDFKLFEQQLNARLVNVEANITASIAATNANILIAQLGHTHIVTGPTLPSGPGIPAGPIPPVPGPTTPAINIKNTFAEQQDAIQQSTGPAIAPLGDGMMLESQTASATIRSDIGLT